MALADSQSWLENRAKVLGLPPNAVETLRSLTLNTANYTLNVIRKHLMSFVAKRSEAILTRPGASLSKRRQYGSLAHNASSLPGVLVGGEYELRLAFYEQLAYIVSECTSRQQEILQIKKDPSVQKTFKSEKDGMVDIEARLQADTASKGQLCHQRWLVVSRTGLISSRFALPLTPAIAHLASRLGRDAREVSMHVRRLSTVSLVEGRI
eukprot:5631728-Amphidinium_carterae.1